MSIYEILAIIAILLALPKDKYRNGKTVAIFLIALLTVVAAIRGLSVGTDTYSYYNTFTYLTSTEDLRTSADEPIFAIYTYFCRRFLNYDWYMFITYGVMIFSFLWISYKKTTNFPLAVFLFLTCGFYLSSFNGMREFLATAIIFWALYILEKDFKKEKNKIIVFFVIMLIAFLIHNTALIVLLVFLIRKKNMPNNIQLWFVIGSFILGFFYSAYFWGLFQPFMTVVGRFGSYLEYEAGGTGRNIISNLGANVMFLAVMYLADKKDQKSIFYKAYFVSIVVFNLVGSMNLLTRLTDNLAVAQIVTIPIVLRHTKDSAYKWGFLILLMIYAISRFYLKGLSNPDILPYVIRNEISFII